MEGLVVCGAVLVGCQAVAAELNMGVDAAVGGQEALRVAPDLNRCICCSRRLVG